MKVIIGSLILIIIVVYLLFSPGPYYEISEENHLAEYVFSMKKYQTILESLKKMKSKTVVNVYGKKSAFEFGLAYANMLKRKNKFVIVDDYHEDMIESSSEVRRNKNVWVVFLKGKSFDGFSGKVNDRVILFSERKISSPQVQEHFKLPQLLKKNIRNALKK